MKNFPAFDVYLDDRSPEERRRDSLLRRLGWLLILLALGAALILAFTWRADASRTVHQRNQDTAHEIAERLRADGHPEDHPVILACQEWWRTEYEAEQRCPSYVTEEQKKAYPVAAADWQGFREAGLSEVCAAAIIGNWMAEAGGHTLDIDPYIYKDGYYGQAMWSLYYCPEVDGMSVLEQIQYTLDTLEYQVNMAGGNIQVFYEMTDVRMAAWYFSKYYERPAQWSSKRADNAEIALNFFTEVV